MEVVEKEMVQNFGAKWEKKIKKRNSFRKKKIILVIFFWSEKLTLYTEDGIGHYWTIKVTVD